MAGLNPREFTFTEASDSGWIHFKSDFYFTLTGTFDATIHLQYSPNGGETVVDVDSFTAETIKIANVTKGGGWFREIIKDGNYVSGSPKASFKV